MDTLLPARREVMRLNVAQRQSVASLEFMQAVMVTAKHGGDFIDEVDDRGVVSKVPWQKERDRPGDLHGGVFAHEQAKLLEKLADNVRVGLVPEPSRDGRRPDLVELLLTDPLDPV